MRNILGAICLLACLTLAAAAVDFTSLQPEGYVNDFAQVIDPTARATLDRFCAGVEQQTGIQIAVITLDTLAGEPIEDVANDIYRKWGIGKKGKDEGLLLLLVTQDRTMRLEVGYGLEPIIPDGYAGTVLRAMRPALKESRYGEAVTEALNVIGARIAEAKGVSLTAPLPPRPRRRPSSSGSPFPGIIFAVIALMWLLGAMGGGGRGRGSRRGGHRGGDVLTGMIIGSILGRGIGGGHGGGGFGSGGGFGGFGGFGGGSSGGGGASSSW